MGGNTDFQVRSEMPGIIVHIGVETGATVAEGDELLIMESMKMEIPVEAPRAGMVHEIHVAVGDRAAEEQLLVTLRV
jgi:biotin carboxyl carrier protein